MEYYTAKEIEKILGIDANTLYHWVQVRHFIEPADANYGRGKVHRYSFENLAQLAIVKELRSWKIEGWYIKALLEEMRKRPQHYLKHPLYHNYSKLRIEVGEIRKHLKIILENGGEVLND